MSFMTDIKTIRERARREIEEGAVTQDYSLDKDQAVRILNEALATEIVCVLRYRFHYFMASGIHKEGAAAEFLEHSNDEQKHADMIAERIKQLGGKPEMNPAVIAGRSHSEYVEGTSLEDMLREDLVDDIADLLFAVEPANVENVKNLYFTEEIPATSRAGKSAKGTTASKPKAKKPKAKAAGR